MLGLVLANFHEIDKVQRNNVFSCQLSLVLSRLDPEHQILVWDRLLPEAAIRRPPPMGYLTPS